MDVDCAKNTHEVQFNQGIAQASQPQQSNNNQQLTEAK